MLKAIRDSILPFAKPVSDHELNLSRAISYFEENPAGSIGMLAETLGCSRRTAERLVTELKSSGKLKRVGSNRSGSWLIEH